MTCLCTRGYCESCTFSLLVHVTDIKYVIFKLQHEVILDFTLSQICTVPLQTFPYTMYLATAPMHNNVIETQKTKNTHREDANYMLHCLIWFTDIRCPSVLGGSACNTHIAAGLNLNNIVGWVLQQYDQKAP